MPRPSRPGETARSEMWQFGAPVKKSMVDWRCRNPAARAAPVSAMKKCERLGAVAEVTLDVAVDAVAVSSWSRHAEVERDEARRGRG